MSNLNVRMDDEHYEFITKTKGSRQTWLQFLLDIAQHELEDVKKEVDAK